MHAAHGRFVKARPARPTSTRLRSRRARQPPSGGSIVAKTKTHTEPRRRIARKDWRNNGARDEMRDARGQPGPRRVDDGDRDAGVHGGEPKQGVRPHLVGRDRLIQARKEAPGVEGVSGRLHRVEERQGKIYHYEIPNHVLTMGAYPNTKMMTIPTGSTYFM